MPDLSTTITINGTSGIEVGARKKELGGSAKTITLEITVPGPTYEDVEQRFIYTGRSSTRTCNILVIVVE